MRSAVLSLTRTAAPGSCERGIPSPRYLQKGVKLNNNIILFERYNYSNGDCYDLDTVEPALSGTPSDKKVRMYSKPSLVSRDYVGSYRCRIRQIPLYRNIGTPTM